MVVYLRVKLICINMLLAELPDRGVDLSGCNQHQSEQRETVSGRLWSHENDFAQTAVSSQCSLNNSGIIVHQWKNCVVLLKSQTTAQ